MTGPTHKQRRLIKSWGLPVPTNKEACSHLINYILERKTTVGQRVRELRDWPGTYVKVKQSGHQYYKQKGTVIAVRVRSPQEKKRLIKLEHSNIDPLELTVLLDIQITVRIHPSILKVINRSTQPLLFDCFPSLVQQ